MAFPDDGVAWGPGLFRDGDGSGMSMGDFTSPSGGKIFISSRGSEVGASPDQDGVAPDYESNADYSSSTIDGSPFPPWVTGFGSDDFESQLMNEFFSDSDHFGGFSFNASRSWSFGLSKFDPSADPTRKRAHCSGDGSSAAVSCEIEEDLGAFMTTSTGAGYSADHSSNFPGLNAPFGGDYLSPMPNWATERMAAQNSLPVAWPWDTTQATFPLACDAACDVTSPVVDEASTATSDVVSLTSYLGPGPSGDQSGNSGGTDPATSVPEIPPPAMLLIGFAGLALIGRRRLWGSAHLG
jgi:hypothetical protein